MDKKTYIAVIIMLSIVLVIALFGWIKTRNNLINYRINNYGQYEKSFAVCDDVQISENYNACVATLKDFANTLKKYERILKNIDTGSYKPTVNVNTVTTTTSQTTGQ